MNRNNIKRGSLKPFEEIALLNRYFRSVKKMDAAASRGKSAGVEDILGLWADDGTLELSGAEPIGQRVFRGREELRAFYEGRSRGVEKVLQFNVSSVNVASARSAGRLVASGVRHVVSATGEGMEVPFTHNFELQGGRIHSLKIHIGAPRAGEVAPLGLLQVEDMGRLAAVAWMVA